MRTLTAAAITLILAATCASASVVDDLAKPRDYQSRRVSSYDKTGGNADGSQGHALMIGETRTLADINCHGEISHIWFTFNPFDKDTLGNLILRMYWDGEKTPSVEAPIGAFFGLGHGEGVDFDSLLVSVGHGAGLNCFFPMPFDRRAKVTIENQSDRNVGALYYYFDYKEYDTPQNDTIYFHAQYRQAKPALVPQNYVALEAVGRGHYVGMFYYIKAQSPGWWGEGDDMIYIDGDEEPTLHGTGMEDYFCHAWGMQAGQAGLRFGAPLFEVFTKKDRGNENTAYRWHIEDAITFRRSIAVTHEHGHANDRNDDFSSVAFWYQTHPHAPFPPLPSKFERLPYADKRKALLDAKKFEEYRELVGGFLDAALDVDAANYARIDLIEGCIVEGDMDRATQLLRTYLGPIPVEGLTDKAEKLVKKYSLDHAVPSSNVWLVDFGDGRVILANMDGSDCFRTDVADRSRYIYLRCRDNKLRRAERNLILEVEYYDPGGGTIVTHYNSAFKGGWGYQQAEPFRMPSESGWQTARIELPRALLNARQNGGADLRVSAADGDLYVRKAALELQDDN